MKKIILNILLFSSILSFGQSSRYRVENNTKFGWVQKMVPVKMYSDSTWNAVLFKQDLPDFGNGYWSLKGNALGTNTLFIGSIDNHSVIFKTNNINRRKLDSLGIDFTYSTSATSTISGSHWNDGNGNVWIQNTGNGIVATFSNTSNYLKLFQDGTVNNWLFVPSGSNITLSTDGGGTQNYQITQYAHGWTIAPRTSGSGFVYQWSIPASTSLTAGSENVGFNFNLNSPQWDNGNITIQRFMKLTQPRIKFITTGSVTATAAFQIVGAPAASTNCNLITNSTILKLGGVTGSVSVTGSVTNSYGLECYPTTGATNVYSAIFMGGSVGIGTVAPTSSLDVRGNTNITGTLSLSGYTTNAIAAAIVTTTATLDFPSTSSNASSSLTVSIPSGAVSSDGSVVGVPIVTRGLDLGTWTCGVTATNVVTVIYHNTGGSPYDPPSGTFKIYVFKN